MALPLDKPQVSEPHFKFIPIFSMIFQIAADRKFPVSELSFSGYIMSVISQHSIKNICL